MLNRCSSAPWPFSVILWAVRKRRECVLIDPAGNEDSILRKLARLNLRPLYLINTHGHADHTSGNQLLAGKTGMQIVMHEADARLFDTPAARKIAGQMGFRPSPPVDRRSRTATASIWERVPPGHQYPRPYPGQHLPLGKRKPLYRRHPLRRGRGPDRPPGRLFRGTSQFPAAQDSALTG